MICRSRITAFAAHHAHGDRSRPSRRSEAHSANSMSSGKDRSPPQLYTMDLSYEHAIDKALRNTNSNANTNNGLARRGVGSSIRDVRRIMLLVDGEHVSPITMEQRILPLLQQPTLDSLKASPLWPSPKGDDAPSLDVDHDRQSREWGSTTAGGTGSKDTHTAKGGKTKTQMQYLYGSGKDNVAPLCLGRVYHHRIFRHGLSGEWQRAVLREQRAHQAVMQQYHALLRDITSSNPSCLPSFFTEGGEPSPARRLGRSTKAERSSREDSTAPLGSDDASDLSCFAGSLSPELLTPAVQAECRGCVTSGLSSLEWQRVEKFLPVHMQVLADTCHVARHRVANCIDTIGIVCSPHESDLYGSLLSHRMALSPMNVFVMDEKNGVGYNRFVDDRSPTCRLC